MNILKNSWRKGTKLLSQLLCIGAVFTACTDDEVVNQADKTPLQVSVNTSLAKQSRAIVHGEWLPAGSSIGVSLFTPTGDDYDNQGFYNIQYKGNGEEEDQVWSSMGVTPAVSANEAVLVAYHPYNDDQDLDITAIPVEIASQTDYMYSGLVTGITNAAPKADIVLDHALTAIRVKLVLGDFTGDAAVSEIAVASPALASSATLNAADGSLDNIAGQGDKFTLPVDFGLVDGGIDNDIMFVPDASVESGVTTVSATIGGKKYTAGIEFDEAYKQGYIYTYTLTLNNSGFAITKVNVNPWETGNDDAATLEPEGPDNGYIVEITVPEDNYEFIHNMGQFVGTIDWGDGTKDTYSEMVEYPSHVYETAGKYTVIASGKMDNLMSYYSSPARQRLIITKLIRIGKEMGVTSLYTAFTGQPLTDGIEPGALDGCTEVTTMQGLFGFSGIPAIPVGLFDKCTKVIDFYGMFWSCDNLKAIPEGLFDKCTEVQTFGGAFANTAITSIPEGLFDKCINVVDFTDTFYGSTSLQSIPEGLFDNNTKVTSFYRTFEWCSNLTGESPYTVINVDGVNTKVHLYERANYPEYFDAIPTSYSGCFNYCTQLTDYNFIPSGWK